MAKSSQCPTAKPDVCVLRLGLGVAYMIKVARLSTQKMVCIFLFSGTGTPQVIRADIFSPLKTPKAGSPARLVRSQSVCYLFEGTFGSFC